MKNIIEENKKEVLILILILVAFFLIKLFGSIGESRSIDPEEFKTEDLLVQNDREELNRVEEKGELEDDSDILEESSKDIMIHICGQVENPGLIELNEGSRVKDAVNMAGGLKKEADLDNINLAKKLNDEDKIYIPKIGEDIGEFLEIEQNNNEESNKLININTATKDELINLPGIGEKTAEKILDYRESNGFNSVDDLLDVAGIGPKKFDDIKDLIIVK